MEVEKLIFPDPCKTNLSHLMIVEKILTYRSLYGDIICNWCGSINTSVQKLICNHPKYNLSMKYYICDKCYNTHTLHIKQLYFNLLINKKE